MKTWKCQDVEDAEDLMKESEHVEGLYYKHADYEYKEPASSCTDEMSSQYSEASYSFPHELREEVLSFLRDPNLNKYKSFEAEDADELRGVSTGIENFHHLFIKSFRKLGCANMEEYLLHYNNVDVEIMHPIIDKMRSKWSELEPNITMFRDTVSLPNMSRKMGFMEAEAEGGVFFLAKGEKEGEKVERMIRRNLGGGPSVIYSRELAHGETILGNGKPVKKVQTWDVTSLYPYGMCQVLPCGDVMYLYEPNNKDGKWSLNELGKTKDSAIEKIWISVCEEIHGHILTRSNTGQSQRVGPYIADGLLDMSKDTPQTNFIRSAGLKGVVYEFLGDYWHGSPELIEKYESKGKKTDKLKERLTRTLKKLFALSVMGYAVVISWEKPFKSSKQMCWDKYNQFVPPFTSKYKQALLKKKTNIISTISDPENLQELLLQEYDPDEDARDMKITPVPFFGFVEIDIEPPEDIDRIAKFEPLFVKGDRNGNHSLFPAAGKVIKTCISTPYLRFCLTRGYKISKVYKALECMPVKCLKPFVDKVVELRRQGDSGEGDPLLTDIAKLVLNSFYGSSLLNKDKYGKTLFMRNAFDVCREVNKHTFMSADMHNRDLFQITKSNRLVKQNVPIQLGKMVLDYAKLHMAHFFYSILNTFLEPGSFALGSMDTDSFTLAITEESLDECVKLELRPEWHGRVKKLWFAHCPPNCNHSQCNKRTPGPLKLENEGISTLDSHLSCM